MIDEATTADGMTTPSQEAEQERPEPEKSDLVTEVLTSGINVDLRTNDEILVEDLPFTVPYELCGIQGLSDIRPFRWIHVNGVKVSGLLDSGAAVTVVSERFWKTLPHAKLESCGTRLRAANGGLLSVVGKSLLQFNVGSTTNAITALVVSESGHDVILGYDLWKVMGWRIMGPNDVTVAVVDPELRTDLNIESDLTPTQRDRLYQAVEKLIVGSDEALTRTNVLEHLIELEPGSRPFFLRSHHFSPALEKKMMVELERMLKLGVIEPSNSPVASPIVPQTKKDGSIRLCLDSRVLNSMTVKDRWPVPNLPAMIGRLQNSRLYISIDLKSAFWQVGLDGERRPGQIASSRELTAFVFPGRGLFHFKVMPFGLCNSPATQCRLMSKVLGHDLEPSVVYYLDDILLMGNTFEELMGRLAEVISRLTKANLAINLGKCRFFCQEIMFLGYLIGGGLIKPDPRKVAAVMNFPVPRSMKEVRRVLGLAGYYRRLIPKFSEITAALSDLLKGESRFQWTKEAQHSFETLKAVLSSEPVVGNPQFELEFILQCDASDVAAAAVLGQFQGGVEIVIAYYSHKWQKFERNWAATEKEAACVLYAIRHFRAFIAGSHFTVITDAQALLHLKKVKTDGSSKLARWALELNEYDVSIQHRKGEDNVVADALSRAVEVITTELDELDPWLEEMVERIVQDPSKYPDLRWENRRLFKFESVSNDVGGFGFAWREYVPPSAREAVTTELHRKLQHAGWEKCYDIIRRQWFWPGLLPEVKNRVQSCEVCLHCKRRPRNTMVPMGRSRAADLPFQMICIDHWGPVPRSVAGNVYLLVVVDVLTKFVLLRPCRDARAKSVTSYLEDAVFSVFGVPEILVSDNARAFLGREMMLLLNKYQIEHWSTPFHHPQANIAERYVQTVGTAVRSMVFQEGGDHRKWDQEVPRIQAALNALRNDATGQSPYKLMFGKEMILTATDYRRLSREGTPRGEMTEADLVSWFDEIRTRAKTALMESQARSRLFYDQTARALKFQEGEKVWRKNRALSDAAEGFSHKLAPKYLPATIIQTLGEDTYMIQDLSGGRSSKCHANDLYKDRPGMEVDPEGASN